MSIYIALFRGINIGGHHLVPMKELAALLAEMGFQHVRTLGQSGNVVFRSAKGARREIAGRIGRRLMARYGFEPKVILLGGTALQEAVDNNPFDATVGKAVHLFFLDSPPEHPDLERLAAIKSETEQFRLHHSIFYLFTPDGVGRSKLAANVEKCLGVPATGRNWNTVCKLLAMVERDP